MRQVSFIKNTAFILYSSKSHSFGRASGLCIVRFKYLGVSSWAFLPVWYSSDYLASSLLVFLVELCVLAQFVF